MLLATAKTALYTHNGKHGYCHGKNSHWDNKVETLKKTQKKYPPRFDHSPLQLIGCPYGGQRQAAAMTDGGPARGEERVPRVSVVSAELQRHAAATHISTW